MKSRKKQKSIFPDLIFSKFFLIFTVILFFVVLFSLAKGTIKTHKVGSDIEDLKSEIALLEKQNQEFKQLVDFLNSETFIEQEAKLKLGYKKPGESLVVIPDSELTESNNLTEKQAEDITNPVKWWRYFFN